MRWHDAIKHTHGGIRFATGECEKAHHASYEHPWSEDDVRMTASLSVIVLHLFLFKYRLWSLLREETDEVALCHGSYKQTTLYSGLSTRIEGDSNPNRREFRNQKER
ncbi:MAG: hypothetical protein OXF84_00925 [Bacteroidetes bacterium]|nr:hypothetical protein [Bacteroidota bacterium]